MHSWSAVACCVALAVLPRMLSADSHISVHVQCDRDIPIVFGIVMSRPDRIAFPVAALFEYCSELHRSGKPI